MPEVKELKKAKSGKKNRKWDRVRGSASQKRYNVEQRWLSNKVSRISRHVKAHPEDKQSVKALGKAKEVLGGQ